MFTLKPLADLATRHILRRSLPDWPSVATRVWEVAPGYTGITKPASYLPGQLERIQNWVFSVEHPRREMEGGCQVVHTPTRAFELKDAILMDGRLFAGTTSAYLHSRRKTLPGLRIENEIERGAIYCTAGGNDAFAHWLMDDCLTYRLACEEGLPITTGQKPWFHLKGYEDWLEMTPSRQPSAMIRKAIVFEDLAQNSGKRKRAAAARAKLLSHVDVQPHPGVFILRGASGNRRILQNEIEVAEHLKARRGFKVIDPGKLDVPAIVAACAGARTVVGVEGSQLMHGLCLLPPGGSLLILQPPGRFAGIYKNLTDRDDQTFGFVVGHPAGDDFTIDPDEVERTLDLFPQHKANWATDPPSELANSL